MQEDVVQEIKLETEQDVPGDNSCLFWSCVLGYLYPVLSQENELQERFIRLFGQKNRDKFSNVKKLLNQFIPTVSVDRQALFSDITMNALVREEFRARVVDYIADNKEDFRPFHEDPGVSFEDYLSRMHDPKSWGGNVEIQAIGLLLSCRIELADISMQMGGESSGVKIKLRHVNYKGKLNKSKNHYHVFLEITKKPEKKLTENSSIAQTSIAERASFRSNSTVESNGTVSSALKSGYQRQDKFVAFGFDDDRSLSIAQHHVELSLIPKSRSASTSLSDNLTQRTLFTPLRGEKGPIRKILIIGEPGTGKSILCHKLAYDWSLGENAEQFQYVFWLTLRNLSKTNAKTLAEWILEECFANVLRRPTAIDIEKILEERENECLMLLDGIDEAREIYRNDSSPQGKFLRNIFSRFSNIVVTSRAHQVSYEIIESIDRHVEIKGFSEEKIDEYITKQFDIAKVEEKEFRTFLQSKPAVQQILRTPLNLFLLCDLWRLKNTEKARDTFRKSSTMTGLYEAFCLAVLRKRFNELLDANNLSDVEVRLPGLFRVLERVAYDYLIQPGQVLLIPGGRIREMCRAEVVEIECLRKSGLLKADRETGAFENATYTFLHKTFQEYFAARYVLRCLQDRVGIQEVSRFIEAEKYNPSYLVTMWFISGLSSKRLVPVVSQVFYDALLTTRVDHLGLKHIVLMVHVLEHWDADFFVTEKKHKKMLAEIFGWLDASVRIPSSSEFQKVIQRQLGDALRVCPKMANICIDRLASKWNSPVVNKKAALICYLIPGANALTDTNKRFFTTVLEEQQGNDAFYQDILSIVSWKPFRYFSDKDRLFKVLEGLLTSDNRLVCASAAYAMAEICDGDQKVAQEQAFRDGLDKHHLDKLRQLAFYNALVIFDPEFFFGVSKYIFEIVNNILIDREDKNQSLKLVLYVIRKNIDLFLGDSKSGILEKLASLLEMSLLSIDAEQEVLFVMQLLDKNSDVVKALTWKMANVSGNDSSSRRAQRKLNYFDELRNANLLKMLDKEQPNEKKIFIIRALLDLGFVDQLKERLKEIRAFTRIVLQNKECSLRASLSSALVVIASNIPDVIPVLREGIENRDPHVRQFSALVLGQLGQSSHLFRPVLISSLDSPLHMIGLEKLHRFEKKIAYALIMLLQSDSLEIRSAVTQMLITMGHSQPEKMLPIILTVFETGKLPEKGSPSIGRRIAAGITAGLRGLLMGSPILGGLLSIGELLGDGKPQERSALSVDKGVWEEILEQLFHVFPKVEQVKQDELGQLALIELEKPNSDMLAEIIFDEWEVEWKKWEAEVKHYNRKMFDFIWFYSFMLNRDTPWIRRAYSLMRLGWSVPQIGLSYVRSAWKKPAVRRTKLIAMDLVKEGYASQEFVSVLIKILETRNMSHRLMVVEAFSQADHVSSEIIDALIRAVRASDPKLRQSAACALVELGSKTSKTVSILVDILVDERENAAVRQCVAIALGKVKEVSPGVVSGLNKTLESPFSAIKQASVISLIQLDQEVSDVALLNLIGALSDPYLTKIALIVFSKLKRLPEEFWVVISNAFKKSNPEQRRFIVMALGNLKQVPVDILLELIAALKDQCFAVRQAVIASLAKLASQSYEVMYKLIGLSENDEFNRSVLLEILSHLNREIECPFSLYKTMVLVVEYSDDPVVVCAYTRALSTIKKASFEKEPSFSPENLFWVIERLAQDDISLEAAILNKFYTENPKELIFNLMIFHERHEVHRKNILFVFKLLDEWGLSCSEMLDGYHQYVKQDKSVSAVELMPLAELVLRRGMLVTETFTDQVGEIILSDESSTTPFQLTSKKYPVVLIAFLYAMQERLAELGLFSLGFQHFVELQKPPYAQSRQRSGLCFFQPSAVRVMGLVPSLTVNQSKWRATHKENNQSLTGFLIPLNSWKVFEQSNVLEVLPERAAIKISLRNKKDVRKRISELHQVLKLISDQDDLACCRYLDLSDNDLDDVDLVELCDGPILKTVHCLVLSDNHITLEGFLELLKSLQELKCSVKYLILDRNYIWMDGRKAELVNHVLKEIGVVHLELSLNYISDVEIKGSLDFKAFQAERTRLLSDSKLWRFNYCAADGYSKSIINSKLFINKDYGVVAYVKSRSALHWKIAIEYIDDFSQRILILADLVVDKIDNKKIIDIRFYFTSPEKLCDKNYEFKSSGTLPVNEIVQESHGLLAQIFKSQELQGFQKYGLGGEKNGNIDCAGWIKLILGKFNIPVEISRMQEALSKNFSLRLSSRK